MTAYRVTFTPKPVEIVVDAGDVDEALDMATERYAPGKVAYSIERVAK